MRNDEIKLSLLIAVLCLLILAVSGCYSDNEDTSDFSKASDDNATENEIDLGLTEPIKKVETEDISAVEEVSSAPDSDIKLVVNVEELVLRTGPGTDSKIIGNLEYGTVLTIIHMEDEWIKVATPAGKEGWVHQDYVSNALDYAFFGSSDYYDSSKPILIFFWEPGDMYWSDSGYESYWRVGEAKMHLAMNYKTVISILGKPQTIEERQHTDSYGVYHHLVIRYPYLSVMYNESRLLSDDDDHDNFPKYEELISEDCISEVFDEAFITGVNVTGRAVFGPRNIRVGDTLDSVIEKVPNKKNSLEELENKYDYKGEHLHYKLMLYGSLDEGEPIGVILYNQDKEPVHIYFQDSGFGGFGNGRLGIELRNNKVVSYHISWQDM